MKNLKLILIATILLSATNNYAQDWMVGGNIPGGASANKLFGITSPNTKNLVFVNTDTDTNTVELARITSTGRWGFGTIAPNARLHINGDFIYIPFRASINDDTKFIIGNGVSVGTFLAAAENGLRSEGNVHIGSGVFANDASLQVPTGSDASIGGGGFIISGQLNSTNVAIDDNEIMARNNGAPATLYLNANGGDVNMIADDPNIGDLGADLFISGTTKYVGIRNNSPNTELHLVQEDNDILYKGFRIENEGSNHNFWHFYTSSQNTGDFYLSKNYAIRSIFNGISGTLSAVSDARFKKNIEEAGELLPAVRQLAIKKYHMIYNNDTDKKHYGLIAQETEKIIPEIVQDNIQDNDSDVYTMSYSTLGIIAIKSLQEQQELITALKIEMNELLSNRTKLKERIKQLEENAKAMLAK
jgi:Chaperone of endosialidase